MDHTGATQVFDLHALKSFAFERRVRTMLFKTDQVNPKVLTGDIHG